MQWFFLILGVIYGLLSIAVAIDRSADKIVEACYGKILVNR